MGMLHDIGLLLAAQSEVEQGTRLLTQAEMGTNQFAELEQSVFGFSHCELGLALATKWSFQEPHLMVIRYHHSPNEALGEFRALCNHFYIADSLVCQTTIGCPLSAKGQLLGADNLEAAGITAEMVEEVATKLPLLMRLHHI